MTNLVKPPSDQVSIDFRQCPVEKKDGGGGAKEKTKEETDQTHHAHTTLRRIWNTVFIISCALAIFNDPLYCYIDVIDNEKKTCITYQKRHLFLYGSIRVVVDIFYIIDLVVSCLGIPEKCQKIKEMNIGACGKINENTSAGSFAGGEKIFNRRVQELLSRIMIALPVLEVVVFLDKNNSSIPFLTFASFQWTLRVLQIYSQLKQRPIIGVRTINWLKPILDFIPFILASHLCGAIWYLLALRRQVDCWKEKCQGLGHPCNETDFRYCYPINNTTEWIDTREKFCPTIEEKPHVFDFGIYLYAIKANVTDSKKGLRIRVSQSFWWALRNLSSFGSNLNTGMNVCEIAFCVVISITGMALFLVYLNARVQVAQKKSFKELQVKEKAIVTPDIDLWLSKIDFPKDLETGTNQKKIQMRDVIMENIHKLDENKDFDMHNILSILPLRERGCVMYHLRLVSLKKVPKLENVNEKGLRKISEYLKPVVYAEDCYIFQEGKPLGKMFFISQGFALTYTDSCGSLSTLIKKGDFYGGELLDWAFKCSTFSDLPVSTRTVIAQEKVEGFVIRASDLINVVSKFWWYFSENFCQVGNSGMERRHHLAAASIQAAWRSRRSNSSVVENKFVEIVRRKTSQKANLCPTYLWGSRRTS